MVKYATPFSNTSTLISLVIVLFLFFVLVKAGSTPMAFIAISAYLSLGNGTYSWLKQQINQSKRGGLAYYLIFSFSGMGMGISAP